MDKSLILIVCLILLAAPAFAQDRTEYRTLKEARDAESSRFADYKARLEARGYVILDGSVVGKNAATGQSEPGKQRTTRWAVPELENGKYYVAE